MISENISKLSQIFYEILQEKNPQKTQDKKSIKFSSYENKTVNEQSERK